MIALLRKLWNNPMTDVVIATVAIATGLGTLHKVTTAAQDRLNEVNERLRIAEAKLNVHEAVAAFPISAPPADSPWSRAEPAPAES